MAALRYFWAFPNTLLGMAIGLIGLCTGGKVEQVCGCLEFHGGFVRWFLRRVPLTGGAAAMTLGHSILGQSKTALAVSRAHEHVHVRQYEKLGPFFLPAYALASLVAWLKHKDPYRDNRFEVEAYQQESIGRTTGEHE